MGKDAGDPDGSGKTLVGAESVDASDDVGPEPDRQHDGAKMIRETRTAARHAISRQ
jgi:hypothetical protein